MKKLSFILAVLCTLGLTANAVVGDEFTLSYPLRQQQLRC